MVILSTIRKLIPWHFFSLAKDCSKSIANAPELQWSCPNHRYSSSIKTLIYACYWYLQPTTEDETSVSPSEPTGSDLWCPFLITSDAPQPVVTFKLPCKVILLAMLVGRHPGGHARAAGAQTWAAGVCHQRNIGEDSDSGGREVVGRQGGSLTLCFLDCFNSLWPGDAILIT